jgi:hypothetical protein
VDHDEGRDWQSVQGNREDMELGHGFGSVSFGNVNGNLRAEFNGYAATMQHRTTDAARRNAAFALPLRQGIH